MRSMISCAAVSFALVVGCGTSHPMDDNGQSSGETASGGGTTEPGGGSSASCPLGAASLAVNLGLSNPRQVLDLAIDATGDAFIAAMPSATGAASISGLTALSAAGGILFSLPAGSLVQTDVEGNIYVAGSFSSRIDLGAGVMVPNGNIDVFVAKLDAHGKILFVKQLGLCGDGVQSMAIDAKGRIAISGSAMGTVVLSASGDLVFQLQQSGYVAFDSQGNLVIAGSMSAGVALGADVTFFGTDMASVLTLTKVDVAGNIVFSQTFDGTMTRFNGIAIDANDNIFLVGTTAGSIDFFGTSVTARFAGESGRVTGGFLVELDSACNLLIVRDLGISEANALAIDLDGNVFVAGAITGNTGFFRYLELLKIDARGVITNPDLALENVNGRAFAVAVDACGSVYLAVVAQASPSVLSDINAKLLKISF